MDRIEVTFRLRCAGHEAASLARAIAYEQTVEVPESLAADPEIRDLVVGHVEDVQPDGPEHHLARISYAADVSNYQLPQLLGLLYGNVSMLGVVRLIDVVLPDAVLDRFEGPRFGVGGVRELTGVFGRPLVATAFKPRGSSLQRLCDIGYGFAQGGGDLIKDDQNLVDHSFEEFAERVTVCRDAVARANDEHSCRCLYFPYVGTPLPELERHLELVVELGLRGVLMSPLVLGLETVRAMVAKYPLVLMAHPSLTGAFTSGPDHGIAQDVLLGTLFRLAGADISVFGNFGGRFRTTREECLAIRDRLLQPMGALEPALPCPAGGMQLERLEDMSHDYGVDAVFLLGGALLGHSEDLAASTRRFVARVEALAS